MRVLIVGGGGREHALSRAVARSLLVSEVVVAPGNPGIAAEPGVRCEPIAASDLPGLMAFAQAARIDLTIVGPEAPLVSGLVDAFAAAGLLVLGPTAAAAALEGSKAFSKDVMRAAGVATAASETYGDLEAALAGLARWPDAHVVVKADGLAAGKGVVVAADKVEAEAALRSFFGGALGAAGETVLLEETLTGDEVSVIALCDGERALLLPAAQDHKRIGEGDTGPNTGGMGAYAPAPVLDAEALDGLRLRVFEPVLREMARRGAPFRGFLFAGLMVGPKGISVLEFNVRLGDPEAQVMLALLDGDPVPAFLGAARGALDQAELSALDDRHAACVVLAAAGYPGTPRRGDLIGLPRLTTDLAVSILHAGTRLDAAGALRTDGGRVLAVTATASTLALALAACYGVCDGITFEGKQLRRDVGSRALGSRRTRA